MAAVREGYTSLLLPQDCRAEWEEVPLDLREHLTVKFVTHYKEVFMHVFNCNK
jgi:ATP-dependent Lon protease